MTNFFIALMKLLSALVCQSVLILMMSSSSSISDMIKDFVAIGFVVEIDNQFASTMKFDGLTQEIFDEVQVKMKIERCEEQKFFRIASQMFKDR